jgi:ornithine carbamoyltransferase
MHDHSEPRHLLRAADLEPSDQDAILALAVELKRDPRALGTPRQQGPLVAIFELPSTRTRLAFAAAAYHLGMLMNVVPAEETQLAHGESIEDTARTLSALCAAIIIRTRSDERLERLASAARIPVMNALTPRHHPCEALVSLFTVRERFGRLTGVRLSFVGPSTNVAHSLLEAGAAAGMEVRIASPPRRRPDDEVLTRARSIAARTGSSIIVLDDPREAVAGADVVYTDAWGSLVDDVAATSFPEELARFRVDEDLMQLAANEAVFLHCLPARRGFEVTTGVIDGEASLVWQQVSNQVPVIQAVIHSLLSRRGAAASVHHSS